jgi:hypothetical protein
VIAHLHFLWFKGELKRELCTDGIYRFSLTERSLQQSVSML